MDTNPILYFLNTQASTSIAGFVIIVVSIIAIYFQRKTTKQKAALDFLDKLATEQHLIDSAKFLKECHIDPETSVELIATSKKQEHRSSQLKLNIILNYFESLSIGVRIGIYDKKTVCLSRNQQIIRTFEQAQPYIQYIRKDLSNDKIFENLEWLANKLKIGV
ncbi:hypothetical protein CRYPA_1453 [uncultured Candidatus Thioglobus sp.]|nr:hypothetical protein CRYPA_1453 [uncultured Candidatus Thioglobus sp.]